MQLKSGIKVYSDNLDDILEINSGITHHSNLSPNEINYRDIKFVQKYEPDAYLPKRDWRKLESSEIKIIEGKHINKEDYNSVFIGEIPQEIKNIILQLDLHSTYSEEEVMQKFRDNNHLISELNSKLNDFLIDKSLAPYNFLSLTTNYPNSEIVSHDKRKLPENYTVNDIEFIGIHKDSSRNMTLHTSHKQGNRFAINLGKESRYLLIINLSILQAYHMIKKKIDIKENEVNNKNITDYFMDLFPDYPMLKIEQKPYHYYIAPTDNCFHDGSTLGSSSLDIVMTYLGKFIS